MTYSYTQISQYLSCPRRYRHRYLDGWQEKDTRAAMLFGRAFEQAVAALFRREDPAAVLFEQWGVCKDMGLTYSGNDTWDRMLQQGIQLLERFAQDGRVRIRRPRSTQQIQFNRTSVPATILSLTSTPLVNWTAHPVFWNGRPPLPDIRKSRPAFPHWIRNSSAIRG